MRSPGAPFTLILAGYLAGAAPASAQDGIFAGMQKGLESTFSIVSTTTTFPSGEVTKTETTNIFPALRLNIDSAVYPNLRLSAGGVFELNAASVTTDGAVADSTITRNRPFFLLRSTSPVFAPGFGYFRREERARTAGLSDVKLVNDEYAGYLVWNPAGGPRSDFQLLRAHTFDRTRTVTDSTRILGSLISNYTRGNLGAYYRGSVLETDSRIDDARTSQVAHSGRVTDSGTLLRKRLVWNATYNISYQSSSSRVTRAGGEVMLPVTPFAGLAALSDVPATVTLAPHPALIDGNLTGAAGIGLGVSAPPEDSRARNIGLDFVNPTAINRFLLWVDRDLPFAIASAFSWEIHSSLDNVIWRREAQVSAAPFGPFENRFEIDFPTVTARYIKVVTRTLPVTVPDASRFGAILVTEMQAFLRREAGDGSNRLSQTVHLVNTDARFRLLDSPSLFYEGFFLYNGPSAFGSSTATLSNGVSVTHTFGRIFSAYGRGALEQGSEPRGDRTAAVTNATFTVDPIPTFRSSLLYTGLDERFGGATASRRAVLVQNAAQLYRGVDLLFGIGWNFTTRETGETSHDRIVNATATIVPRPHVSLTLSYDETATERAGMVVGSPRSLVRRVYAAAAVDPTRTLRLALGHETLAITGQQTRRLLDVAINWAPFPDGALQFGFAHNEAIRTIEFGNERNTAGIIRWNLSRRSYVDVSYQKTRREFVFEATDMRVFSVGVRLFV